MTLRLAWLQCRAEQETVIPHCGHAPSCHRYVGVALVVVVSAGFLESALFLAGFPESATP